jgi:hypothetical protein
MLIRYSEHRHSRIDIQLILPKTASPGLSKNELIRESMKKNVLIRGIQKQNIYLAIVFLSIHEPKKSLCHKIGFYVQFL